MNHPNTPELSISQRRILDLVRRETGITRADLGPLTGLTKGAISRLVRELLDGGLLVERDRISGMRGQPALPLEIDGNGGVAIGVAFPYGQLDAVALDYSGQVLSQNTVPFDSRSLTDLQGVLGKQIGSLKADQACRNRRLLGVGIAIPGHLRSDGTKDFVIPPTLDWLRVDALADWLSKTVNAPIFIENIANAAAISETNAPSDTRPENLAAINLGHGIGLGLLLSGRIHRGAGGLAGEIGSLFPQALPRPSAYDLLTAMRSAGRDVERVENLEHYAEAGDPVIEAWIARAAQQLFPMIKMLHLMASPERMVITGMLPKAITGPLSAQIDDLLKSEASLAPLYPAGITPSEIGMFGSAIGAAWLPILSEGWEGKDLVDWGDTKLS